MKNNRALIVILLGILTIAVGYALYLIFNISEAPAQFDGQRAYADVLHQESLGPRLPGSDAHANTVQWIAEQARAAGWDVQIQETSRMGHPVRNIVASRGQGSPWIILGAHYDSRFTADQDPDPAKQTQPVPGANDGASGVAVLLELARTIPPDTQGKIWLAFFDVEDQGDLPGWDWILGSRAMAESLTDLPDAVVIVDMIGDANLNIHKERNSDPEITRVIWESAAAAGFEAQFIPSYKFAMLDDHTPFLERGIRAVDIIDFDYPHWHTTNDTADKVSPESLEAVGKTLLHWLGSENPIPAR